MCVFVIILMQPNAKGNYNISVPDDFLGVLAGGAYQLLLFRPPRYTWMWYAKNLKLILYKSVLCTVFAPRLPECSSLTGHNKPLKCSGLMGHNKHLKCSGLTGHNKHHIACAYMYHRSQPKKGREASGQKYAPHEWATCVRVPYVQNVICMGFMPQCTIVSG